MSSSKASSSGSESESDGEIPLCDEPVKRRRVGDVDASAIKTSGESLEARAAAKDAGAAKARAAQEKRDAAVAEERRRRAAADAAALATARVDEAAAPAATGEKFVNAKRKPVDESTRAKNRRKERLGQAKFTLKEDRDCPSVWDGGAK